MDKYLLMLKLHMLLKSIFVACVTFFLPIFPSMIAVGILILIDTLTGIIAAKKTGETITSKKMGGCITKSIVYQLLIISAHLCETFLFAQIPFVKISLAFLAMTEFTSVNENIHKSTGKSALTLFKSILDSKLRGFIKNYTDEDVTKTDSNESNS